MNNTQRKIAVRFPPSPTGELHIGNIRTILFNYLFAKHNNGDIYMRFEDTDRERSKKEYEQIALDTLIALGLKYDYGPYRQSEREQLYTQALNTLIENDRAYEAEDSKDDSGDKVIRFKNPNKVVTFNDVVRGEIKIDTTDFGDFIIARSKTKPLYHLTVVVDDIDMNITHVIRGEDHITSTPRQILLIEALGEEEPTYAHLPMIIGEDKKKLSKRHGAVTYQKFAELGYLPEAIINYLALLGWNAKDNREYYTIDELIKVFSLENVTKAPAMFSYEKLDSINKHYISLLSNKDIEKQILANLTKSVSDFIIKSSIKEVKDKIIHSIIKERINKWSDVSDICNSDLSWLESINLKTDKIIWKKSNKKDTELHLKNTINLLSSLDEENWTEINIKEVIWPYADKNGRGDVLWPMRYSLTGNERSPDPFSVAFVLGKQETLSRLQYAIDIL